MGSGFDIGGDYSVGDIISAENLVVNTFGTYQVWSFTGHTGGVRALAVDSSGNVYSGSNDNTVRKISPTGNQVWSFTEHTGSVLAVAVYSDGNVYSGSWDRTVRKISSTGNQVWSFTGHIGGARAVAVDSSGNVYSGSMGSIFSGNDDNIVRKIKQEVLDYKII